MQYTVILLIYFFLFYWHNLLFKNTEIIYNSETYCISFTLYLDIYISFIVENNHYLISAFQESTFQRRITQSFLIEYFLYTYQHINSDIQCINKNKNIWYKQHYHTDWENVKGSLFFEIVNGLTWDLSTLNSWNLTTLAWLFLKIHTC